MKMSKLLIIVLLLHSASIYAGSIRPIKKDEPSPYDGFVIDKPQEKKFRTINEEKKLLERKVLTLEEFVKIHKERFNYQQDINVDLHKRLKQKESDLFWNKTIYFIGGIFLTGFVSYAAMKYGRR
jgi:hypothetical protein